MENTRLHTLPEITVMLRIMNNKTPQRQFGVIIAIGRSGLLRNQDHADGDNDAGRHPICGQTFVQK